MSEPKPQLPLSGLIMAAAVLLLFPEACNARSKSSSCGFTFCGEVNISHPFRLTTQPHHCGDHKFELDCDNNNNRTSLVLKHGRFYVRNISYDRHKIQLIDSNLSRSDDCSLPTNSLLYSDRISHPYFWNSSSLNIMYLVNCTTPMKSSLYINASRCPSVSTPPASYFYFLDQSTYRQYFDESCTIKAQIPVLLRSVRGQSTSDIYEKLLDGFELSWRLRQQGGHFLEILVYLVYPLLAYVYSVLCFILHNLGYDIPYPEKTTYNICLGLTGFILARASLGIFCLIGVVVYKWRRRHLSADDTIEEFLQRYNYLMPIRYSRREIRKMTGGFKDKLGEGGYGSVFKGKLRSGSLVAVKVLGKSKANGEDFINEVATIGRIHHINVAKLIGFCVEGSKQALVYDFMPNGSLDRIIFAKENKNTLSWQQTFDVAVGVARGIEYLHRGCDMQILHFDIKPHNILLDENFIPKISDFGLAKLCSVDDSIVLLTAARGTIGYIAPELVYKNLGGISYKADVYSFGMLLMEMVGRRKNLNPFVEQSSQIYFPSWISNRYYEGEDIELGDVTDDEKMIVRKLVITASWCIQMKPIDRPSMSKVLEMFETDVELLRMPPNPFQLPHEISSDEDQSHGNTTDKTSTLLGSSYEISLNVM
ncbi:hypothetical protein PTKIN_Ptkin14bG0206200 [Pterospermum kingtungense]